MLWSAAAVLEHDESLRQHLEAACRPRVAALVPEEIAALCWAHATSRRALALPVSIHLQCVPLQQLYNFGSARVFNGV